MTWRPTDHDRELLAKVHDKLGVKDSEILRMALHRLAEHEGIRVA